MAKEIKNKIALVTGGSAGIGSAIAAELVSQGAKTVIIVDVDDKQGMELMKKLNAKYGDDKVVFYKGDVTIDLDRIYNDIIETYKTIDIVVNNAGIFDETSARRTLEVNTIATIEWSMKFLENMRRDKGGEGGTILNISSIIGNSIEPFTLYYRASKFAVNAFTRTLGNLDIYGVTGVRVIALCPGVTITSLTDKPGIQALDFLNDITKKYIDSMPSQEKEDVGRAAVEVISNAGSGSVWNIVKGELKEIK